MTYDSLDVLGASASTAGDDFHELWALRQALSLLDPLTELTSLVVEGLPKDAVHAQVGEAGQAADVTRTLINGQVVYEQLKYSTASPNAPWTWTRLMARRVPRRRDTSVLGKLADLYVKTTGSRRLRIVTNQPVAADVRTDLLTLADDIRAGRSKFTQLSALETCTGLKGKALAGFLDAFDLTGFGEATRLRLETDILKTVGAFIDADARNDLRALHERISSLILPENRRNARIDRETILTWLGAGTQSLLFPAPARITPADHYVEREATKDLIDAIIMRDPRPIRLHAGGGCGKTSFVSQLGDHLPSGSETFLYDCYGGGLFLASEGRRHLPRNAFVQIANELAGRMGSPFALRSGDTADLTVAFRNRVDAAAQVLKQRSPDSLLVLTFDAADNARTAAERWREPCFLDELTAIGEWPANVRILITCRTGGLESIGPETRFRDLLLGAFSENETRALVRSQHAHWSDDVVTELQDLSGGTPRRLAYALDGVASDAPGEAIRRLMPRAPGMDPLFVNRVREAGVKVGDEEAVWRLLCALANLPRPTPASALATAAEVREVDIPGLANDLGGLVLGDSGWSFHDEDFEAFVGQRTQHLAKRVLELACDDLNCRQAKDAYAARSVAEAMLAAGQTEALYALAHDDTFIASIPDEAEQVALRRRRIILALRATRQAGDILKAQALLLKASHALRSHKLQLKILTDNLDLASRFSAEEIAKRVLLDHRFQSRRGALRLLLASSSASARPAEARNHLRWWHAWTEDRALAKNRSANPITAEDLANEFEAHRKLYGLEYAVDNLLRWRPHQMLFVVVERLVRLALADNRITDVEAALGRGRWPRSLHLHIAATLTSHGSPVNPDLLHKALEGALRRPAGDLETPRRWDRHRRDRAAQERVLAVLEASVGIEALAELTRRTARRWWNPSALKASANARWVAREGDLAARAIAVLEKLGPAPQAADFIPDPRPEPPPAPPHSGRGHPPSDLVAERAHREWRNFTADRASDLATLERLVSIARTRLAAPGTSIVAAALDAHARSRSNERTQSSDGAGDSLRALHAADVVNGKHPTDSLWTWLAPDLAPSVGLARLKILAARTRRIEPVADRLTAYAAAAETQAAPASTKAQLLVDCARIAMDFDIELARVYYDKALTVTTDVDLEAVEYLIAASVAASDRAAGSDEARRNLAEKLADTAAAVQATLGDEAADYMPWSAVVAACAVQHPSTALAVVGRWRDDGFVRLDEGLAGLMDPRASALYPAWMRAGVSVLEGRTAIPPSPTVVEVERAARGALIDGSVGTLIACSQEIESLEESLKQGPWTQRIFTTRDTLLGIESVDENHNDNNDNYDFSPENAEIWAPITTTAELQSRLLAFSKNFDRPYCDHFEHLARTLSSSSLRLPFLKGLADRYGGSSEFADFLTDQLPRWLDYPTVQAWARDALPMVIEHALPKLFGMSQRETNTVEALLALVSRPSDWKIDLLFKGVERHGDDLPGSALIALTGVIGRLSGAADKIELVGALLDHSRAALNQPAAHSLTGIDAPHALEEAVPRFLFALMADVDKRVRWQASHAARDLLVHDLEPGFTDAFVALLDQSKEPVFARPDLFFYLHAARLQVAITLHRTALERPAVLARHVATIAQAAIAEPVHVLIRECLAEAARALDAGLGGQLPTTVRTALTNLNKPKRRSTVTPATTRQFGRGKAIGRDDERYHFDTTDTLPYWFSPASTVFDTDRDTFARLAERWILDVWQTPSNAWKSAEEPRRQRMANLDYQVTGHRHGSLPTVERLPRYVEWHAMFCVMGELLVKRPSRPAAHGLSFESWLRDYLLTENTFWLSDLLGPPPAETRFWRENLNLPDDPETARSAMDLERFGSELRTPEGHFIVEGSYDRRMNGVIEHVRISSALVSPSTAQSLALALETARDSMDFCLPGGDDDHEICERGFQLKGWLTERQRDPQLDRGDAKRRSIQRLPAAPVPTIFLPRILAFDIAARAWTDQATGFPIIHIEQWDWDWDYEETGSNGWRAVMSGENLASTLDAVGQSLIVEVKINHVFNDDGARDNHRERAWRMFVIDKALAVSRRDSNDVVARTGRYWVRRLNLEPGVNTLARWLVHHIAVLDDLRNKAQAAARPAIQARLSDAAVRLSRALKLSPW